MQKILKIDNSFYSLDVNTISNFLSDIDISGQLNLNDNFNQTNNDQVHDIKGNIYLSNDDDTKLVTIRSNLIVNNNLNVQEKYELGNQQSTIINELKGNIKIGSVGKLSEFMNDVLFNENVYLSKNLNVQDIEVTNNINVSNSTGNNTLNGNYQISNQSGSIQLNGNTEVNNLLTVKENQTFKKQITVEGLQNFQDISLHNMQMDNGNFQFSNTNITGSLNIDQDITFTGYSRIIEENHTIYNVKQFGQKQDGITDDTQQIQQQVDFVDQKGGGVVYFPDSKYEYIISDSIKINDNIILKGDNKKGLRKSIIKPQSGFDGNLIQNKDFSGLIKFQGVIGLYLDGQSTTLTQINLKMKDGIIDNNTIINCWTYGIQIGGTGAQQNQLQSNNTITNNYLQGFDLTRFIDGILIDNYSQDFLIRDNYIENIQNQNIHIKSINNRIISNHLYNSDKYGIEIENSMDNIISENYIENIGHYGIKLNEGNQQDGFINTMITNNIFRNINNQDFVPNSQVIYGIGTNLKQLNIVNNIVRRDNTSFPTIDYLLFCEAEQIQEDLYFIGMNQYPSDLIQNLKNF